MELRSGRRLGSVPTPRPRRSLRRPPGLPDGGGSDRISALPDDMLLQILARLRCARAAAHTSGLSRRWRGLWMHLPELSFRDISADAVNAALGQVACPALSLLEVYISPCQHGSVDPARVSALLRAAARLAPADLVFDLWGHFEDRDIPVEIPCFERATSVKLDVFNLFLTLPAGGAEFPLLERLSIDCRRVDTGELVLRCPRLHVLEVRSNQNVGFGDIWRLTVLRLRKKENVGVLRMSISPYFPFRTPTADRSFSQEIAQLPAFSVLELHLQTTTYGFGALVSHLLGICSTIKRLKMAIEVLYAGPPFNPVFYCDQPLNWRNEVIPLTALEEVEIVGFCGTGHEFDLLKLLFRCAASMKRMNVVLHPDLSATSRYYRQIYSIFQANPHVKCSVYRGQRKR